MRMLVFRHFDFDDPSVFIRWAQNTNNDILIYDPSIEICNDWLNTTDMLVILGGPMSVYQEEQYPWLVEEKAFLKKAIDMKKRVLGICLGAQMIADVLGAKVYAAQEKEIGWHKMYRNEKKHPWLKHFPDQFTSFSWHGDTFDLPDHTVHLISSEACSNQAFSFEDHVLALQFHLETSAACIDTMLTSWTHELINTPYIQHTDFIRSSITNVSNSHALLTGILNEISLSISSS